MSEIKKLKNLVISIMDYPHMPYWSTLEEAIVLLNFSYETAHDTILVFDESYKLIGVLDQKKILRNIHPGFSKLSSEKVSNEWKKLISTRKLDKLKKPIKDFITPLNIIVDVKEHVLNVAHLMLKHNIDLIAVKESENVVGVVKMHDIFHEIAAFILKF